MTKSLVWPLQDKRQLGLFLVGLAIGHRQAVLLLRTYFASSFDGDVAVRLVAFGVGLALEAVEERLGEDAVLAQVQRRLEAVVGQEDDAAGLLEALSSSLPRNSR